MRVVHLLTQGTGGPADHVADVAPVLAARGHDVVVVMPDGAAAARVEAAGVVRHRAGMASKTAALDAVALVRLLRRLHPDVLHCQDRRAGLVGRTGGRLSGAGLVYTLHGAPDGLAHLVAGNARIGTPRRRDRLYYLAAERWLSHGGRVVVPSEALAAYLVDHVRVPRSRVDVVRNGVDLARFRPGAPAGNGVVWVGLMAPVKRLDVLLDALALLPGTRAVVAGDGPMRPMAEERARLLGDRVALPGFVADPASLVAGAGVVVLTSDAENCPLVVLQALASGVPVVATRVGGVPEIVRDGVDGLLVPPGDPAAVAEAVGTLLDDPARRARMGAAARARAEEAFGIERCADGLLATYERVLA